MADSVLIKNIGRLVTMEKAAGREGRLGVICGACLKARDGRIEWFGRSDELPNVKGGGDVIDAEGGVAMPGFVDCHTHLVHAGSRQHEFNLRSEGRGYKDIAAGGGGIMSTVRSTREATAEELFDDAVKRADEALRLGTTTIEIKTGYGLDAENEMKMARVIDRLSKEHAICVVGTFLGAHVVPPEYRDRRGEYVDLIVRLLPEVAEGDSISACDVFVEDIAFTAGEARTIAKAAREVGLGLHLHVDQFGDGKGGNLAAELGALSADHLDHTSEDGMEAMAKAGVVGVVLPEASFFAGGGRYPDVRRMVKHGLCVAVSTDYNPGTAPSVNLMLNASIAVAQMGMTCDDALLAITRNAAMALGLGDRGIIGNGMRADLVILDAPDEYYPLYRFGKNCVQSAFVGGNRY